MGVIAQISDYYKKKKKEPALTEMSAGDKQKTIKANPMNAESVVMQIKDRKKKLKELTKE